MLFDDRQYSPHSSKPVEILRRYLSDIVYGATDGIITTFVIVSGVEGAKMSPIVVVILGLVNLFSDGISMGASSFLSIRTGAIANSISKGFKIPFYHACVTFFAFVLLGAIPLISFLIPSFSGHRFSISCILTGMTLFLIGTLRALVVKERPFQGAFEMLCIGGLAAGIAYALGHILSKWIS